MVNLGTGVGTSVNDIVRELNAILGFAVEPIYEAARPGEVQRIYLDATRAKQVLGWTPTRQLPRRAARRPSSGRAAPAASRCASGGRQRTGACSRGPRTSEPGDQRG